MPPHRPFHTWDAAPLPFTSQRQREVLEMASQVGLSQRRLSPDATGGGLAVDRQKRCQRSAILTLMLRPTQDCELVWPITEAHPLWMMRAREPREIVEYGDRDHEEDLST
jgi:hypothetical protein